MKYQADLSNESSMKIKPLTTAQRHGWYFSSFIYGIFVFAIPGWDGIYLNAHGIELFVICGILGLCWIVGVLGLRLYVQDKDPNNFQSLLGLRKSKARDKT